MKAKVLCLAAVLLVGGISAYLVASFKQHEVVATASAVLLADVQQEFELLSLLESQQKVDRSIRDKFDFIVSSRMTLISAFRPKVGNLDAVGAEGLCNLINYYENNDIVIKEDAELTRLASSYISEVRKPLMEKVSRGQELTGRSGCDMIGDENGAT